MSDINITPIAYVPDINNKYIVMEDNNIQEEYYCGRTSCGFGVILGIIFWPLALFIPCFPCDKRFKRNNQQHMEVGTPI